MIGQLHSQDCCTRAETQGQLNISWMDMEPANDLLAMCWDYCTGAETEQLGIG